MAGKHMGLAMCVDQVIKSSTEVTDRVAKFLKHSLAPHICYLVVYVLAVVSPVFFHAFEQGHQFKNVASNTLWDLQNVPIHVSMSYQK